MLPRAHRLHRANDFRAAVCDGRRAGSATMVVHAVRQPGPAEPARIGLVVSKAVGAATVRNQVKRRLRSACRPQLNRLAGLTVVIRATPPAAEASLACLSADLDRCLRRIRQVLP